jgi:hypothetical protein
MPVRFASGEVGRVVVDSAKSLFGRMEEFLGNFDTDSCTMHGAMPRENLQMPQWT